MTDYCDCVSPSICCDDLRLAKQRIKELEADREHGIEANAKLSFRIRELEALAEERLANNVVLCDSIDDLEARIEAAKNLPQLVPRIDDWGHSLVVGPAEGYETETYVDYDELLKALAAAQESDDD